MKKIDKEYYFRCSPYCFKKMPDGHYLALNREYLPVDRSRDDVGGRLDSSAYDNLLGNAHKKIGIVLSKNDIRLLKHSGDDNMFWLYRDECAPWDSEKYKTAYDKKKTLVQKLKWLA
ncbi:MAG: hypothetical protein Q8L30_00015 [bacterium]|nr:hypothetical protein [bacterium]